MNVKDGQLESVLWSLQATTCMLINSRDDLVFDYYCSRLLATHTKSLSNKSN